MVKRVVSIEAGVWWTKVALADYRKKNPPVHKAFAFRTRNMRWKMAISVTRKLLRLH